MPSGLPPFPPLTLLHSPPSAEYKVVQREQVANPAPLGLFAFGESALNATAELGSLQQAMPCQRQPSARQTLSPPRSPPLPAPRRATGYTTALLQGANTAITEKSAAQLAAA